MEKQRGHVLVLTYPAQGHINPLLQFAKRLVSKGLKATFATTHYTVNSIHADGIDVHPISDGYDDAGFKQASSTEAYLESFKTVGSRTLAELILKHGDSTSPVNCVVYDSLFPWALDVARKFGIYGAAFMTNSASVCSLYWHVHHGNLSFPVKPEEVALLPGLSPLGYSDLPSFLAQSADNADYLAVISAYLAVVMEQIASWDQNDWVFLNTFEELESELAKAMSGLWQVTMVGPMVPSAYLDKQIEGDTDYGGSLWNPIGDGCLKWLETKLPKSVIYVSFGSMAGIAPKQVEEIACGLKGSNSPFLWVVKETEDNKLSNEILNSVDETGLGLVVAWCNQLEVLAHPAVGCFITHCGWNSTLEALSLGVPMVAVPQWSDQPTNAKLVDEVWRVGMRAKKDEEGIVRREEVEMCVREVMVGKRSKEIRTNASKWREHAKRAISGGSSSNNIDKFVEVMLKGKGNQT